MKKSKILTSLAGLSTLSMVVMPAIASCSNPTGVNQVEISGVANQIISKKSKNTYFKFVQYNINEPESTKVKLTNLKVDSAEATPVTGLIKSTADSAGNIKVVFNADVARAQYGDAFETITFDLLFTNKKANTSYTITGFEVTVDPTAYSITVPEEVGFTWTSDIPSCIIPPASEDLNLTFTVDDTHYFDDTAKSITVAGQDITSEEGVVFSNGIITIPKNLLKGNVVIGMTMAAKKEVTIVGSTTITQGNSVTYSATDDQGNPVTCDWSLLETAPTNKSVTLSDSTLKVECWSDPTKTWTLKATPQDTTRCIAKTAQISINQSGPKISLDSSANWAIPDGTGYSVPAIKITDLYYKSGLKIYCSKDISSQTMQPNIFRHVRGSTKTILQSGTDYSVGTDYFTLSGYNATATFNITSISDVQNTDIIEVILAQWIGVSFDNDTWTACGITIDTSKSTNYIINKDGEKTINIKLSNVAGTITGNINVYANQYHSSPIATKQVTITSETTSVSIDVEDWTTLFSTTYPVYVKFEQ